MSSVLKDASVKSPANIPTAAPVMPQGGVALTKLTVVAATPQTPVQVPLKARMIFFRQWATCIKAGMSMAAALHHLTQVTSHPELREAARKAQICVEGGGRLSAWMKTRAHIFSGVEATFLYVGEVSGSLDMVIDRLATELENEHTLHKRLFLATFISKYILLPLLLLVPNTPNIMMHGLDELMKHDAGLSQGAQQAIMLRAGLRGYFHDLIRELVPIVLTVTIAYIIFRLAMRTEAGRRMRDQLILLIPFTGALWRDLAISRYLTALTLLTRAGVVPAAALEACAGISGNLLLDEKFAAAAHLARTQNLSIPAALTQTGIFSEMTLSLLRTGNYSGSMVEMLERSAAYYETDVQNRLIATPRVVGILCFILCAVATGIVVGRAFALYVNNVFPAVDKFMGVS
ncbi:MAG: type II secretion system F family protein [Abitibacteriaceae bacterium]|nr:type II secretion system F family protein [Abditibacteriaceae bacterium]